MKNLNYPLRVFYSEEDEGFIVVAPDLPGCSAFGETPEQAVKESRDAILAWIQACKASGRPVPPPSAKGAFSGKFIVRIPPSLHRTMAEQSEQEGVSLNQYVECLLAKGVGSPVPGSSQAIGGNGGHGEKPTETCPEGGRGKP